MSSAWIQIFIKVGCACLLVLLKCIPFTCIQRSTYNPSFHLPTLFFYQRHEVSFSTQASRWFFVLSLHNYLLFKALWYLVPGPNLDSIFTFQSWFCAPEPPVSAPATPRSPCFLTPDKHIFTGSQMSPCASRKDLRLLSQDSQTTDTQASLKPHLNVLLCHSLLWRQIAHM